MVVEEEFQKLLAKITNADVYKRESARIFPEHEAKLIKQHEQLPEWIDKEKHGSQYFVFYSSPSTSEEVVFKTRTYKLDDQIELNTLHRLKTYQWLLAEAYEAFEDFIEIVYADCGVRGSELWVKPDKWKYEGSKDISHYYNPRRKSNGTPYVQLKALRERSAHFRKYETKEGRNYRVAFVLIEKLRHLIVHEGGYCLDFDGFMKSIQRELSDVSMKNVRSYVESYFIPHRDALLVDLLELPAEDGPIGAYHDYMSGFFKTLIEYALLVKESIEIDHAESQSLV
ncbi:hypothetical protein [Pseudomonas guariconensis]|uniref:hypothetical protein n=1 Tax=Pseudomonas guariconensis TaxID=1288410 RepID=UPI0018ABF37C|nr:hypothetical protein [Pseudomonas guariconensis]MBF8740222.1 hypothetical protein [Pseudomonas guariconensis]MBF8750365.1 hypothetical protein [Pseudomonas guariconensis]